MLDAAKNAKALGYLLFILALVGLVGFLGKASEYTSAAVALSLFSGIGGLVTGYGLIKQKVWSIYGVGVLALLEVFFVFYNYSLGASPTTGTLVSMAIYIILFFWFFGSRDKFIK